MTDQFVIETTELYKNYGAVEALRGLNLQVPRGSIYGFLGRNGAGKTTTIKVLLGMVRATGGVVRVFSLPSDTEETSVALRRRTGFVSEDKDLYDYMTVEEMIRFTAAFYMGWRSDLERRYLRAFDLPPERKVNALSRGMRTKLALLLTFCRGVELLILDEPTSGLDPAMVEEVLQALVAHVADQETTVFFSSHQIAEVDQIADRVAVMHHGRAVVARARHITRLGTRASVDGNSKGKENDDALRVSRNGPGVSGWRGGGPAGCDRALGRQAPDA